MGELLAWGASICSHTSVHPHTSICPSILPLYTCMFPLYHMFPICHQELGGIYTPHLSWGLLGGISISVMSFLCLLVHPFASQFIHYNSCSPSLWVVSLLDWMPMYVFMLCFTLLFFLCSVFIMSKASTIMAMTTIPPVTVYGIIGSGT